MKEFINNIKTAFSGEVILRVVIAIFILLTGAFCSMGLITCDSDYEIFLLIASIGYYYISFYIFGLAKKLMNDNFSSKEKEEP